MSLSLPLFKGGIMDNFHESIKNRLQNIRIELAKCRILKEDKEDVEEVNRDRKHHKKGSKRKRK